VLKLFIHRILWINMAWLYMIIHLL